jgi:hypothetical protein
MVDISQRGHPANMEGSPRSLDSLIRREVAKGTRYWGTHGKYVKKNLLLGFVQELEYNLMFA